MANLQDLFNELQADDRVITPDTFEEFQSKMESPEYASRVNDVLKGHGYDVNAYEGLKKKEESMVESAPLSQSESEQPSETTEPTQVGGTEPIEEEMNLNEVDVNQFSQAFKAPEIEMPIAAVGVNPISDNQNQNVVKPVQNQVAETQQDLDHPVSKIANLAKNLKGKLTNHPFMSMSKDIALGTAAFSMEEDEVENTLDAQEDIDKDKEPKEKKMKRKTANQISLETGLEFQTRSSAYDELEDIRIYGMKTNPEKGTVEFIYKEQDKPGSRGVLSEVPIDSATYKEWVSNRISGGMGFDDYNGNDQDWEDLKRATLTVSGYKPTVGGQEAAEDINTNYQAHLEKTKRSISYILPQMEIKEGEEKDKTLFEKVVDYTKGKISDVEAATVRANEYLKERARKRQEDVETYRIAEQTVANTSYVTKADDSFRNSPYNSSWTNDILEKYQIPISELLLDGNKEQILNKIEFDYLKDFNPKITAGDVNATGIPGQELSPFAEETRDEYAKRLKEAKRAEAERLYNMARRDAQFHLAELAIMNQIEKGNPKFRYEDVERLRKIKNQGLESANVSDYATGYEDQAGIYGLTDVAEENYSADINIANAKFARNMIDYASSEYTGYYKSLAGISAMNLEDKGISNDSRSLNGRKKELASKVEEAKKRNNIPDDAAVKNSVKGAKAVVTEMTAIDKQIEEKTNQYNAMLVEENGQKVFKSEDDFAVGEKIRGEVEALLQKREEVKLKMNEFSPVLDVVQKYSDETRDAYNEMMTIDSELSRFGSDKDVKLLQDLSPTLELIEGYDLNREMTIDPKTGRPYAWVTAGRKTRGELGEFTTLNTYEDNLEASEKAEAENDTWVEAFGKGVWGTVKNMGGSTLLTGEYLSSFVVPGESFLNDDPTTWTAVDNRKAMYENKMERIGRETVNPAYETWGAKWIVGSLGSIAPYIYASWAGGGSGGFFQIAKSQGLKAAASKTLTSQTTAFFTTLAVGNYTKEFEDAGYDPATALLGGSMLGAATSWMESLFPELPEFERLAMQSAVKKIVTEGIKNGLSPQQITRQLLNGFWKTTGKSIVNVATGFAQEGSEEGGTFIVEQGVMSAAGVRENEFIDPMTGNFGSTTKDFLTTVGLGGITGIFTSSGSVLKTLIQEKSTNLVGKQAQLSIAENYDDAVSLMSSDNDKFKESDAFKQVKNIKDRYDEMASNPKFQEFDDVAKGEILNANIELTKMMDSDKTLQSKGITDIKLQEDIKNTQDALNKLFEVSQERVDQRNELNNQLKELGVKAFQVNAEGKVSGMQFDEMTTTEEQNENTPKAVELIEKTNTKTQENAIQEPSTGEVLQRQPQEAGEAGSQRQGVEPVLEGKGATQEGGKEEIIATPQEKKETEAMQTDIDQVQQSTGTVINLNEDGTLTINAPQRGGQSKKAAAIENAKQELVNLGYNVESRVAQPTQQEVAQEEGQREFTDEEFGNTIKETEGMGVVAGTQSMNDLQKRTAQDPKKGKIVAQASRAVNALKSLFPNMNIVVHESDESYNKAMNTLGGTVNTRGQFVYKPSADGSIQGAVHINLDRANARTIAHEVTHAALLKMFKGDGKVFGNFKEKLKDIAKDKKITITDKDGNQVETTWGDEAEKLSSRYETEDQAEEYLSELAGLVAELDVNKPEDKSILKKIAEFINNFILSNPQLKALGITPISDTSSAEEVLEFFDTLGKKISRGEEIDTKTQINDAIENNIPGEVVVAGVINKEAIAKSQVIDTPILNVYQSEETEVLPVLSMQDIFDRYDGKVTAINSDPTRVGELTLISGKKIFMYGGPNYASLKKNISSNIGFATTQLKKVLLNLKYAKSLSKDKPVATLIVTQTPLSLLSNSYSLRYVLDAISQLPKSVRKSKEFKTEFFGKDLVTLKNAFGEKAYNEFVKKYSKIDLSDDVQMDKMIEEMAYKLADDNNPASFKARGAFLSNLLGGIAENKSKVGSGKKVGYYSKTPTKFIAKQLFERFGLNAEKLFYEIGEKSIVDAYMNDGVWGIAVGGFETDPNADAESVQSGGVKHPLFNAKFPGKNHFALNGGYLIDELFLPEAIEKEGGKIYIKKASQMLAGSMYLKGVVEKAEPKIELGKKTKLGVKTKAQLSEEELNIAEQVAGNAKSIMDTTGVSQAEAIKQAVLEVTEGDQDAADRYLKQPGIKELLNNKIKQIKAKTERELEAESLEVTISERKLLLDRVKAEVKAALEGRKEGKKEGVEQGKEQAQKTIDALNKKLEEGKITKQELQDRIKELGYNIRFEAGVARLAGEKAGKSMGKKLGEFVGYFKGLKAGRTEQRGLGALVSEYIKDVVDNEFGKKGSVSPATLKSISRRAATISNQKQLDAFVSYLDKIIANRRLAEGINEIQRQQKKLLNKIGYQYTSQMKQFAKFDLYTADGDLAFDMNTLEEYLQALEDLNQKVPNIGKMMQLFDDMYDINQQNMPADIDIVEEFKKYQDASTKLFQNTVINNFDDYKKFKREVNKYIRAVNNLLDLGAITELQHQSFLNSVVEGDAKYNTYAGQFQDEIDALKKTIIDGIVDKSTNSLWDSIKDWLTNSPNNFTRNQKKLIEQLQRVKADNLMTLSLDDLDLLNQVVTQIAENGFVDEKNLRSILDRAEIRGEKIGEQLISQSNKMSSKYKGVNAFMKMSLDLLNKSVVFWESRLGMKENGAFRKNVIDPITNAINGWTEDTQRILKGYRDSVVKLKLKGSYKVKTTKLEKGQVLPTGKTRKISKEAYRRVKIGVIGHILDNAWNAKQKKKVVNDWLGDQLRDNSARNAMADESIDELDIVQDVYNDLLQQFSDANGNLDHMAILEAFEDPQNQGSVMSADELEYYDAARTALQESGEYINSANSIRNKQHELNPYYMPRQSVGEGMSSITSNDISYNQELGTALRSSASYARTLQVPKEAIRFNVDRLVSVNVTEGLRDYYLTDAKRYVNEVFSNARENATNEEMDVLRNLQRLNNTRIPFALRKVQPAMIVSPLMNLFYTNALIGIYRTPVELINNVISYSLGNRSSKSITMPFSSKEKEQTNNLLSEFQSSVQFEEPERQTRFINKKWYQKGVNGYISTQKASQLLIPALNNISSFMRKGEWKTQFERAFENATGEKFNYEKHFVKEKAKYFDDMEQAASDADFNVRRIIKGGNKAEQRQFVQWVPLVKKGRVEADSNMAAFIGMFSGFIGHDVDNMTIGLRKAVKPGEVKDGVTQFLGAAMRLSLYPTLMLVAKSLGKMYFGDDDEKEEGKETLDTLKTPEGWADLAIYTSKQLVSTSIMGKYAFGGKVVGNLFLHAAYTLTEDRKQRRFIEDTMRELYFTDPIDLKYFNKDDWQLQMVANLEPISKMLADNIKDLVDDINNKGTEKVTLYDIYEWTQQTAEGKEWLYMANSIITLAQVTSIALTGTALPFVDDAVNAIEDYLSKKELDPRTTYETPGGKKIDMKDLILDTNGRIEFNMPGITPRDRDRLSELATKKFNELLDSKGVVGSPGKIYGKLKFLSDLAKYEAAKELGYSDKEWSNTEGELVSAKPEWELYKDYDAEPEDLKERLHTDIAKGKQLSFTQNLKEKRRIEDFLFKAMDNNPQLKQAYKDAPDGGKLGVREYYKDLYLYEKYRVTTRPKERDYFRVDGEGKIKQAESIPQEKK